MPKTPLNFSIFYNTITAVTIYQDKSILYNWTLGNTIESF